MSKNAMAGAVTLCGVGLCMIGGAMLMQSGGQAHAAGGVMPAAAAVASAANAQAGPTVVWYQALPMPPGVRVDSPYHGDQSFVVLRAWSDGKLEGRFVRANVGSAVECELDPDEPRFLPLPFCNKGWHVIASPT
jgi:hypothetical protein